MAVNLIVLILRKVILKTGIFWIIIFILIWKLNLKQNWFFREVTKRFRVDPGNYLIIPSTDKEDRDCEFILRVYTETQIYACSLNNDKNPDDLSDDDQHFDDDGGDGDDDGGDGDGDGDD